LQAQGIQGITPPTPTAYEMTSFEAMQPSMYTGVANINVPLYSFDFEGMQIPLSLSYNARGIKVNQEASEVGLGWSLNATAVISRTVEGIDDLFNGISGTGYAHHTNPVQDLQIGTSYWNAIMTQTVDTQPDIFTYNFFGYSGEFIFKKKTTSISPLEIEKLTLDDTKIEFNSGQSSFTITTPAGFQGVFSAKERTTTVTGTAGTTFANWKNQANYNDLTGLQNTGRYRTITSWYLTSITAPNRKVLNFEYDLETGGQSKYISISQPTFGHGRWETQWIPVGGTAAELYLSYTYYDEQGQGHIQDYVETVANSGGAHYAAQQQSYFPVYRVIQEHVYLSKIEIPNELRITFNKEDRHDLETNGLAPLTLANNPNYIMPSNWVPQRYTGLQIEGLISSPAFNRNITFHQTYFHSEYLNEYQEDDDELQYMRSRLDEVSIDDQSYRFEYNYGENGLPNKSNWGIDNFGYFLRDIQSNRQEVMNRYSYTVHGTGSYSSTPWEVTYYQLNNTKANLENTQVGTLKRVYYPTGGYTEYAYELNQYYAQGTNEKKGAEGVDASGAPGNVNGGGLRVKSIASYTDANILASKKSYQYTLSDNVSSSGKLMTPLWNYFYMRFSPTATNYYVGVVPANEILASNSAQGSNIGYSRVVEVFEGGSESFSNIYTFENEETVFEPDLESVNRVQQVGTFKNGQLMLQEMKNASNALVAQESSSYYNTITNEVDGMIVHFGNPSPAESYLVSWHPYTLPRAFTGIEQKIEVVKNTNGDVTRTTDFIYNSNHQLKEQTTEDSAGDEIKSIFIRPYDIASPSADIMEMKDRNIVSPVIETIQKRNGVVISAQANKFVEDSYGNIVLLEDYVYDTSDEVLTSSTNGSTFDAGYTLQNQYTKYDSEGNLLEVKDRAGIYSSLIWGHNNMVPVVKGEGITHAQLSDAYEYASSAGNYETAIRTHNNTISGFVTTYDYNPFVGMLAQHDPNKFTTSYEYDAQKRLKNIKDTYGNITQYLKYNFSESRLAQLVVASNDLSFGVVPETTTDEMVVAIKNIGNAVQVVNSISFSGTGLATSLNQGFSIAPGETFLLPLSLTPPASSEEDYEETVTLYTGTTTQTEVLSFPVTATVDDIQRDISLIPTSGCVQIDAANTPVTVYIQNTGNDYLEISHIEIDENETVSDSDINDGIQVPRSSTNQFRPKASGGTFELAMYIAPNAVGSFTVLYGGYALGNWDGNTLLKIWSNATNGFNPNSYTPDKTIELKKNCN